MQTYFVCAKFSTRTTNHFLSDTNFRQMHQQVSIRKLQFYSMTNSTSSFAQNGYQQVAFEISWQRIANWLTE